MRQRFDEIKHTKRDTESEMFKNDMVLMHYEFGKSTLQECVEVLKGDKFSESHLWCFFSDIKYGKANNGNIRGPSESEFDEILKSHLSKRTDFDMRALRLLVEFAPGERFITEVLGEVVKPGLASPDKLSDGQLERMSELLFGMLLNDFGYGTQREEITKAMELGYNEAKRRVGSDERESFWLTRSFKLGLVLLSNDRRVPAAEQRRLKDVYAVAISQASERFDAYNHGMPDLLYLSTKEPATSATGS